MSKRGPDFKGPANARLKATAQRGQTEGGREGAWAEPKRLHTATGTPRNAVGSPNESAGPAQGSNSEG